MMPSKPDLTRVCKFNCCYGCETYTVPANITGNDLLNVNNDCIYVLHPALTKSIDKLQRKKIKHFNLFVLGKGMSVPQDKLMQLVADYRNNTIKKSDFDSKYYSKQMKKD